MPRIGVGVLVILPVVKAGGVRVNILELAGDVPRPPGPDILPRRRDGVYGGIGLWRGGQQKRGLRQGICASGSPSCTAASTQAFVTAMAMG